jgi:hypothetical protein
MVAMKQETTQILEMITPFVKEWLENQWVLAYRFSDTERVTVDCWINDLTTMLATWPRTLPLRLILDIRCENAIISAYAVRRCRELSRLFPSLYGKVAILITDTFSAQIAALVIRGLPNKFRERLIFHNEADAIEWLLEHGRMTLV